MRDKRFCDDIVEMEQTLANSIMSINGRHKKLNEVLVLLCKQNICLADDATLFEAQIAKLTNQVNLFMKTIEELSETKNALQMAHDKVCDTLTQAGQCLETVQTGMRDNSMELHDFSVNLFGAHQNIIASTNRMAEMDEEYHQLLFSLRALEESLQTAVAIYQTNVAGDTLKREQITAALCVSVGEKPNTYENTDAAIDSSREFLAHIDSEIERHQKYCALMVMDDHGTQTDRSREKKNPEKSIARAPLEAHRASTTTSNPSNCSSSVGCSRMFS